MTEGIDDIQQEVVDLLFHNAGEQAVEFRRIGDGVPKRILHNDMEHLVEQLTALNAGNAGIHPLRPDFRLIAGEVGLIDEVDKVEQVLFLRNGDRAEITDDLVDVAHDGVHEETVDFHKFAQERADIGTDHVGKHIRREAALLPVRGEIGDCLNLAGLRIRKGDGADMGLGGDVHDDVLRVFAHFHKAHGRWIRQCGACLNIVERIAAFRGEDSNVVRVHMSREDDAHPGVGILRRDAVITLDEIHGHERAFHAEVLDQAVVLQPDDNITARLGFLRLFDHPLLQLRADGAAGLMLVFAALGVIRAVAAGVDCNDGIALCGSRHIGEASRLFALRRREGGNHRLIGVDEIVRTLEILRVRARGRNGIAVGGVEVLAVLVAVVMVTRRDIDLQSRQFLLQRLQLLRHSLMALQLTVLGEVAGNQEHIRGVLRHRFQHFVNDRIALREHFPVAVEVVGIVLPCADHARRKIMRVGHHGNFQRAVPAVLLRRK